ncbi:MAG TPA: DNA polymerase III subunit gamma/tau [Bacteroidales bacterium]|nr:DNA polymerase III subunit gamma/tau [Bacteroidales bacterium]
MKKFVVSARKYRPDTFDTVIGQVSVTTTLKNSIRTGHLAHAYLFCGPRGVGKTTCARIFAKTINCMNLKENTDACNECVSCRSFNESRAFNIHELDAASNNSVDDIRNLIDQVRVPPQVGKYSIYIIDEVHMLSAQAFNAFLKTLEEPPSHAIFVLATTEKHKIIPTILSRCQIFDFNRIAVEDIVEHLGYVAKKENITVEIDVLDTIAQKADGSMRDALTILDQIASFTNSHITYSEVIESLNVLDFSYYFNLTDAFLAGDVVRTLLIFDNILKKGFDAHHFVSGLSKHFRDLLVCKDEQTLILLEVGNSIKQQYKEQAAGTDAEFLFKALEIANECDISFKSSKNQRLHVELMLMKICNIKAEKKNLMVEHPEVQSHMVEEEQPPLKKKTPVKGAEPEKKPLKGNHETRPGFKTQSSVSIKDALNKMNRTEGNEAEPAVNENGVSDENTEIIPEKEFTQEELVHHWLLYADRIKDEMPRFYSMLKSQLPNLKEDHTIALTLISKSQAEDFNSRIKAGLLDFLRDNLQNKLITIDIHVAEDTQKNGKKPYTAEEKFKYMAEKNPVLQKLKQEFNLDFE